MSFPPNPAPGAAPAPPRPAVLPTADLYRPGRGVRAVSATPAERGAYTKEQLRGELARRRKVDAAVLDGLPGPDEAPPPPGGFRPDLWPPRPPRPPERPRRKSESGRGSGRGSAGAWSRAAVLGRLTAFAAARGPDFAEAEFLAWGGIANVTVDKYLGTWGEARRAAGLPPRSRHPDRLRPTLHRLLSALHRRRGRPAPTVAELAAAAEVSVHAVRRAGGLATLRGLYGVWAGRAARDGRRPGGRAEARRRRGGPSARAPGCHTEKNRPRTRNVPDPGEGPGRRAVGGAAGRVRGRRRRGSAARRPRGRPPGRPPPGLSPRRRRGPRRRRRRGRRTAGTAGPRRGR